MFNTPSNKVRSGNSRPVFKVKSILKNQRLGAVDVLMFLQERYRSRSLLLQTCYLAILCYNFGVETYERKKYEQSSFWLR